LRGEGSKPRFPS
jgi:hypothetical protein